MTHILTVAQVKSTVGLSKLPEERRMDPFMVGAHKTVKAILKKTLYDRLIAAIEDDATLAGEADLLELRDDYIIPFMAWEVYRLSINRLYGEFDRNGAHYKADVNTVQLDAAWKKTEEASAANQADIFKGELLDFLEDNSGAGEAFEDWNTVTDDEQGENITRVDMAGIYAPWKRARRVWR